MQYRILKNLNMTVNFDLAIMGSISAWIRVATRLLVEGEGPVAPKDRPVAQFQVNHLLGKSKLGGFIMRTQQS